MTRIEDDVFADLLEERSGGFALLVDSGGPIVAGSVRGGEMADAMPRIAVAALEVTSEAGRSTGHFGIGEWSNVVCESERGAVAFAWVGADSTAVVGAPSPATAGPIRRLLGAIVARGSAIAVRA